MVASCAVSLTYTYFIRVNGSTLLQFWIPLTVAAVVSLYAAVHFKSPFPIATSLALSFMLHVTPFIRQPPGFVWNNDAIYVLQVANNIVSSGRLVFGSGTGMAPTYTYYPLFYLAESAISLVPAWNTVTVVKYSMSILNLLTLITFYLLVRDISRGDHLSSNLAMWLYALNPMFQGFNSYAHPESFAIIFYPLVLMYSLRSLRPKPGGSRSEVVLLLIFIVTISLSHHFTSYVLAMSLVLPAVILYLMRRNEFGLPRLAWLSVTLPLAWLLFVSFLLLSQLRSLELVFQNLVLIHRFGLYSAAQSLAADYYPSELAQQIALARDITVPLLALFGFACFRSRRDNSWRFLGVLLLVMCTLTFVSLYLVHWGNNPFSTVRTRIVEFAYFPMALFAGVALSKALSAITALPVRRLRLTVMVLIIVGLATWFPIATVYSAFPRYLYDNSYTPTSASALPVAAEEQYYMAVWLRWSLPHTERPLFSGNQSAISYVAGYALYNGTWANKFLDPSTALRVPRSRDLYYVHNGWQMTLPSPASKSADDLQRLSSNLDRTYSDGIMSIYFG
jgi:hypothetical protein